MATSPTSSHLVILVSSLFCTEIKFKSGESDGARKISVSGESGDSSQSGYSDEICDSGKSGDSGNSGDSDDYR